MFRRVHADVLMKDRPSEWTKPMGRTGALAVWPSARVNSHGQEFANWRHQQEKLRLTRRARGYNATGLKRSADEPLTCAQNLKRVREMPPDRWSATDGHGSPKTWRFDSSFYTECL